MLIKVFSVGKFMDYLGYLIAEYTIKTKFKKLMENH